MKQFSSLRKRIDKIEPSKGIDVVWLGSCYEEFISENKTNVTEDEYNRMCETATVRWEESNEI